MMKDDSLSVYISFLIEKYTGTRIEEASPILNVNQDFIPTTPVNSVPVKENISREWENNTEMASNCV